MVNNVSDEVTILTNISKTTGTKSPANSQKQPAANNDACTCRKKRMKASYTVKENP